MKVTHYIQVVLFLIASTAASVSTALPQYAAVCQAVGSLATSLLMTLGLVSGSVTGLPAPAMPSTAAPIAPKVIADMAAAEQKLESITGAKS